MKTFIPNRWLAALLVLTAILVIAKPSVALAAHTHDHIYVTMVEYLGYNRSSQHYMLKVRSASGDISILHFLSNISSLRGHEGERMQISLSEDGRRWTKLSFRKHGTWRIHEHE